MRYLIALLVLTACVPSRFQTLSNATAALNGPLATVMGTVTDSTDSEVLIGATVHVAGTTIGTVTDFDGAYALQVPADTITLEFSYPGFRDRFWEVHLAVGDSLRLDVVLGSTDEFGEPIIVCSPSRGALLRRIWSRRPFRQW